VVGWSLRVKMGLLRIGGGWADSLADWVRPKRKPNGAF